MIFRSLDHQIESVILNAKLVYTGIDTAKSLTCFILLKYKQYDDLCRLSISPMDYLTPSDYRKDRQAIDFLSKWELLPTSINKERTAFQSFLKSERTCTETNKRFEQPFADIASWHLLEKARARMDKILGPCPTLESLCGRFGPGATATCRGKDVTIAHKLSTEPSATSALLELLCKQKTNLMVNNLSLYRSLNRIIADGPCTALKKAKIQVSDANRLVFVPKTAKTHRSICIEPDLNMYFQLGVGGYIRRRLISVCGLNLDTLADSNRHLAYLGSKYGSYATIDLSNASDTISFGLVSYMLPEDWMDLLGALRSPTTILPDGTVLRNSKFSSMGNGYTFELESLVFTCLLWACNEGMSLSAERVNQSFGDDCVINTESVPRVLQLFDLCGFTINEEKTFIDGPFRESCGKDFFRGVDVRPIYQKRRMHNEKDVYGYINRVRLLATSRDPSSVSDIRYRDAWLSCLRWVEKTNRFFGPMDYTDRTIWVPRSEIPIAYNKVIRNSGCVLKLPCLLSHAKGVNLHNFDDYAQIGAVLYTMDLHGRDCLSLRNSNIVVKGSMIQLNWSYWEGCWA